jgi:hypothetical protein
MKRLKTRGASVMTPRLNERDLKEALGTLGVIAVFGDAEIHKLYLSLAEIYGAWRSEQESMEAQLVAHALRNTGRNLMAPSKILSGHETGLRDRVDIAVTNYAIEVLALDTKIGSVDKAKQLLTELRDKAATVGQACTIAYEDLAAKQAKKTRAYSWYDQFTSLLLNIGKKAGVKPNLNKDRITQKRGGWLFEAAQALEPFLDPDMQSSSQEACGKRLQRSRKQILNLHRQLRRD